MSNTLYIIILFILVVISIITIIANYKIMKNLENATNTTEKQKEILQILINGRVEKETCSKIVQALEKALVTDHQSETNT